MPMQAALLMMQYDFDETIFTRSLIQVLCERGVVRQSGRDVREVTCPLTLMGVQAPSRLKPKR